MYNKILYVIFTIREISYLIKFHKKRPYGHDKKEWPVAEGATTGPNEKNEKESISNISQ